MMPLRGGDMFRGEYISEEYPPIGARDGYFDERGVWHDVPYETMHEFGMGGRSALQDYNQRKLAELETDFGGGPNVQLVASGGNLPELGGYGPLGPEPGREDAAALQSMLSAIQQKYEQPPPYKVFGLPNKATAAAHGGYGSEELLNWQNARWDANDTSGLPSYTEYPNRPNVTQEDAAIMKALEEATTTSKGTESTIQSHRALMNIVENPESSREERLYALGILNNTQQYWNPFSDKQKLNTPLTSTNLKGINDMIKQISLAISKTRDPRKLDELQKDLQYWMSERDKVKPQEEQAP